MQPASKQDVQNITDNLRNRLFDRMPLRQDFIQLNDTVKTLCTLSQQNQQLLRQAEYQRLQLIRRTVALETRIAQMEQEIRGLREMTNRAIDTKPRQVFVPVQQEQPVQQNTEINGQYVYRPV